MQNAGLPFIETKTDNGDRFMNYLAKIEENTSLKIRTEVPVRFKKSFPGYSPAEVDKTIDRLKGEIQALDTENMEQLNRLRAYDERYRELSNKVSHMEAVRANETENLMLIMETAKTTADQIVAAAQKEADLTMAEVNSALQKVNEKANYILRKAAVQADEIVKSAQEEATRKKEEIVEEMYAAKTMFADISNMSKTAQNYLLNMFANFDDKTAEVLSDIQACLPLNNADTHDRQIAQATAAVRLKQVNDE